MSQELAFALQSARVSPAMRKFYPPLPPVALVQRAGVRCRRCRYELRTLAIVGRCPECGMRITDSLGPPMAPVRRLVAVFALAARDLRLRASL
jgi:hypothetical protein